VVTYDLNRKVPEGSYDAEDNYSPTSFASYDSSVVVMEDGPAAKKSRNNCGGMDEMQRDMSRVVDILDDRKMPALSDSDLRLMEMQRELEEMEQRLRQKKNEEELYYDSLEMDYDKDKEVFHSELSRERRKNYNLRRENEHLLKMLRNSEEKRQQERHNNGNGGYNGRRNQNGGYGGRQNQHGGYNGRMNQNRGCDGGYKFGQSGRYHY